MLEELSKESLLLMYVADELSEEQRIRVDEMLVRDESLRAQLDEVRVADETFLSAMARSDATQPLAVSQSAAVRKVARAMQQWQVDRYQRPTIEHAEEKGLSFPWWCYPLATAAAAVFALIVWVGNEPEAPTTVATNTGIIDPSTEVVARAEQSWALSAESADIVPQLALGADDLSKAFAE